MKTSIVFSRCGLCQSHSNVSLANGEDPDNNNEIVQEQFGTVVLASDCTISKGVHADNACSFESSNEAVSDVSSEICRNGNVSLSSAGVLQNLVNESYFAEDKENYDELSKDLALSVASSSNKSTSPSDSPLSSPFSFGSFSFDSSDCEIEMNLGSVWQQMSEINGLDTEVLEHSLGKTLDGTMENTSDGSLSSKSGTSLDDSGGSKCFPKAYGKQFVSIEKLQYSTQVTASIKENTGKKRGRKKMYNTASCLEEEMVLKRARNNEACGKYRTMKKKKLTQLFEEERALNEDNIRLKSMCEQMEAEKKLLTDFLVAYLKKKSHIHTKSCGKTKIQQN